MKSRPRILTMPALLAALVAHNDETGKEHSYPEKLEIVRQQIQLRKQLDRIHKVTYSTNPNLFLSIHSPTEHPTYNHRLVT